MVVRDFGTAESKEVLEIRDFSKVETRESSEIRDFGVMAWAMAEVMALSENLEIKFANCGR